MGSSEAMQLGEAIQRLQAEEALRNCEAAAKRLAQENAVMAEIARIISSTLNIEEVYERFAEEARKLSLLTGSWSPSIIPEKASEPYYALGLEPEGRRVGDVYPIAHSAHEEVMRTRASLPIQPEAVGNLGFTSAAVGDMVLDKGGYGP